MAAESVFSCGNRQCVQIFQTHWRKEQGEILSLQALHKTTPYKHMLGREEVFNSVVM